MDLRQHHSDRMSTQAWMLFAAMSVIWGLPYLFIKVAVAEVSPATLVFARTTLALIVLLPLALHTGALRPALRHWRPRDLRSPGDGIPWLLLGHAETRISSALADPVGRSADHRRGHHGVPLGDRHNVAPVRVVGMVLGLVGVGALVGVDATGGHLDWLSVAEMLTVATWSMSPRSSLTGRRTRLLPLGTITVSILLVSVAYLPFGLPGLVAAWPLHRDRGFADSARPDLHRAGIHPVLPADRRRRSGTRGGHHVHQPCRRDHLGSSAPDNRPARRTTITPTTPIRTLRSLLLHHPFTPLSAAPTIL